MSGVLYLSSYFFGIGLFLGWAGNEQASVILSSLCPHHCWGVQNTWLVMWVLGPKVHSSRLRAASEPTLQPPKLLIKAFD